MTIAETIKKYGITIMDMNGQKMLYTRETAAIKRDGMMDELKARKAEIIAHIEAEKAEKKAAFKARYPWAAAYIKAARVANKHNPELVAIGHKALETVIDGDWERAMEEMDKELDEFAKRYFLD